MFNKIRAWWQNFSDHYHEIAVASDIWNPSDNY